MRQGLDGCGAAAGGVGLDVDKGVEEDVAVAAMTVVAPRDLGIALGQAFSEVLSPAEVKDGASSDVGVESGASGDAVWVFLG